MKNTDSETIRNFTKTTCQNLIYDPYIPGIDSNISDPIKILQIIDNEDNWNKLLEGLTKDNLGLTGLAGIGIGLLQTRGQSGPSTVHRARRKMHRSSEHRAQSRNRQALSPAP